MKFVTISDVHIREPGDGQETLFLSFLSSEETAHSDIIFLLGDIFDLVVGSHKELTERFRDVFEKLIDLAKSGKIIYQFEGNHDFHFREVIENLNTNNFPQKRWHYFNSPKVFEFNNETMLFAHGDEFEKEDISYIRYRKIIRSRFVALLANSLFTYSHIQAIGLYFANRSRNRNEKDYGNHYDNEHVKLCFRKKIKECFKEYKVKKVICGHSHCIDEWAHGDYLYLNNGYFPKTKSFIFFNGKSFKIQKLE